MSNFVDNANATALMGAVEESIANTRIFSGTLDEYDALTPEEKAKYKYIATPDQEVVTKNNLEAEIADIVNVYGAKNLIPYPYNETTKTTDGITFTDNGDGTVSVSGTATGDPRFYFQNINEKYYLEAGKAYTLSQGFSASGSSKYRIELALYNGTTFTGYVYRTNTNDGTITFTIPTNVVYDRATLYILVLSGAVISTPITFKPMIRFASIEDDTWVPYAKTNKELTDNLKVKTIELTNQTTSSDGKLILTGMGHKMAIVSTRLLNDSNNRLIVPFGFCYSSNGDALFMLADNSDNTIITSSITLSGTMEYIDLS